MKNMFKFKLAISFLCLAGILIILFGGFSIKGGGFVLECKNIDVLINKESVFKAPSVFNMRFQMVSFLIILPLILLKPMAASIASAVVCLACTIQSIVFTFTSRISPKYSFFIDFLDFCLFIIPFIMLALFIIMLFVYRKNKAKMQS